ncbi:beta-mannosidase, partial [Pestalotiopsis sp. NC0098]
RHGLHIGWFLQRLDDDGCEAGERLECLSVPTDVYRTLLAHERIADPDKDLNELSVRWIADQHWKYSIALDFDKYASVRPGAHVDLVFEGLDTFATVWLDGEPILETDNMFLSHRCDIRDLIVTKGWGSHTLEIIFNSARLRGQELVERHKHEHRFIARQSEDSRIPVRKAQYHWGWDWGPILTGTSGPWRPVSIEYYLARIDDLWAETTLESDGRCTGLLHCKIQGASKGDSLVVSISYDDKEVFGKKFRVIRKDDPDSDDNNPRDTLTCPFTIESPMLWFPFSHGPQSRYKLSAVLSRGNEELDSSSKLIGIRKVELIQEPDDFGKSFYFRINNVDVFMGGSCWIPASNYLSKLTKDDYHAWAELLRDGNQNMVRVWGGGVYEDDAFYDACDELGIMVWQDFCFACGNYPTYGPASQDEGLYGFRASVEKEARQNLQRLRSHPSLVIWAGSNEDYQVQERYKLEYNYDDKDSESWLKTDFPARYYYEYLFPKIVAEEHKGAVYHPTSPWGDGKRTDDPTVGDIHQWNIWHGTMEKYQYSEKLGGRFVSEFGMIAYPHLETINAAITDPKQRYPGSVMMDFHNKAIGHERRLMTYIAENFQVKSDLASIIHLSQIVQADAMAYAYSAWRKSWGTHSQRKCGGVLVWQLNDCWPTISWAVIDHYRVKKPAYYSIQRALDPVSIRVSRTCNDWTQTYVNDMLDLGHVDPTKEARTGTECEVWVMSNFSEPLNVRAKVRFVSIRTGADVLPALDRELEIGPNCTTTVLKKTIDPINPDLKDSSKPFDWSRYDPFVMHAVLSIPGKGQLLLEDTAWPQPFKYLDFSGPRLVIQLTPLENTGNTHSTKTYKELHVRIQATAPVKGLVIEERQNISLSSNNFDIIPGATETFVIIKGKDLTNLRYTYVGAPSGSMPLENTVF